MDTKICTKCKREFPATSEFFFKRNSKKETLRPRCKKCTLKENRIFAKKWAAKTQTQENKLYWGAYTRAKKNNLEFTITEQDIKIPIYCPLLHIKLYPGKNKTSKHSPSLDRKDNSKGYTKENIWVISHLANNIKRNSNLKELKLFAKNILKQLDDIV